MTHYGRTARLPLTAMALTTTRTGTWALGIRITIASVVLGTITTVTNAIAAKGARFYKTRSLAANAVKTGRVKAGGEQVKAAREVAIGDALSIDRGAYVTDIRVLQIASRRGPAGEAAGLYEETPESIERRERLAERRRAQPGLGPPTERRPDKRTWRSTPDLARFRRLHREPPK